jgi:hypothetical protein
VGSVRVSNHSTQLLLRAPLNALECLARSQFLVELDVLVQRMSDSGLRMTHLDQYLIAQLDQTSFSYVPVNLRELHERRVDNVFAFELCTILVEAVCDEDRNVIQPRISGSRGKENPLISSSNT